MLGRVSFALVRLASLGVVVGATNVAFGFGGNNGTVCPTPVGPDVIVGDIVSLPANYTSETISTIVYDAFSFGTTSCNVGNQNCNWFVFPSNDHPAIAQGMFKFNDNAGTTPDKFEMIGISWLKHGFTALTGNVCGCTCNGSGGNVLGVGCSDPYTASRNGTQGGMGPRYQVNAYTGVFPSGGPANPAMQGASTARRLRVRSADLAPSSASVKFFVECMYVSNHEPNTNGSNNPSYRQLNMSGGPNDFTATPTATTQRQQAGIRAWKDNDPSVTETDIQLAGEGLFILAAKATDLGGGQWQYDYALQNVNSDRSGQAFSVPLPAGAVITNEGFHDIDYSSNDGIPNPGAQNFSGTDWPFTNDGSSLTWATQTLAQNVNANALRWATMYNFRFVADVPPQTGDITLTTFKIVGNVQASTVVPGVDCDDNNVADAVEIAADPNLDLNTNGILDECEPSPCVADIAGGNGEVDVDDLLVVINTWGDCIDPKDCPADIAPPGGNDIVDVDDLLEVINAWGPCK